MKKLIWVALWALTCGTEVYAQKTTVKIQDTQARLLDVKSNAYVKPLTVELKVIDQAKLRSIDPDLKLDENGRLKAVWLLTKEQVEVEMNGDLSNIRSWGIYQTSQRYHADVIVAATFNFKTDDEHPDRYLLTVVGYPANFVAWKTAETTDYEWIRMEKTLTTADREKISAIVK